MRLAIVAVVSALCCWSCSMDSAASSAKALENGDRLFAQKQYAEAVVEYRRAVQSDPRSGDARYKLAQSYDALGDGSNAAREYVRAADLLPQNAEAQIRAGAFLLVSRNFEDAKSRAQAALKVDPKNVEAHLLLAEATAMMSHVDSAIQDVERTIEMDPTDPRAFNSLGRYQLAEGDRAKAEQSFKRAVEIAPKSLETVLAMGQFYVGVRRYDAAEEWLKKAVALAPQDPQANRALAALYISSNRLPEAEQPLRTYALASASPVGRLTLADYYFREHRLADARQVLEPLQDDKAFFGPVRVRLAILDLSDRRTDAANSQLEKVLANDPANTEALVLKGRVLTATKSYEQALTVLRQAVEANPKAAYAHYYLGVAYTDADQLTPAINEFNEVLKLQPGEVGSMLQLAQIALRQGRNDAALSLARQAVQASPANGQARLAEAAALIATGDLSKARVESAAIAAAAPTVVEAPLQLGKIALLQRDFTAAERSYRHALELQPGNFAASDGLLDVYLASGRPSEARAVADKRVREAPTDARNYFLVAKVSRAAGDMAGYQSALEQLLALEPTNAQAQSELGQLYLSKQDYEAARKQLQDLVTRQPNAVWAQTLIGITYERQNRESEAEQQYLRVLQGDPHAAIAANNLAMLYIRGNRNLDLALQYAQTAKAAMPASAVVDDTLGLAYAKKGLSALAVAALTDAVGRDKTEPVYAYHLALAHQQNRQKAAAREMFGRALSLSSTFEGADDARAQMRALGGAPSQAK